MARTQACGGQVAMVPRRRFWRQAHSGREAPWGFSAVTWTIRSGEVLVRGGGHQGTSAPWCQGQHSCCPSHRPCSEGAGDTAEATGEVMGHSTQGCSARPTPTGRVQLARAREGCCALAVSRFRGPSHPLVPFLCSIGGTGGWSAKGCELLSRNRTHVVCQCSRAASCAVLMDISRREVGIPQPPPHQQVRPTGPRKWLSPQTTLLPQRCEQALRPMSLNLGCPTPHLKGSEEPRLNT